MAKLVLSSGGSIVFQCFLEDEALGIGRAAHNQIVIADPGVSEEHAAIVAVGNDHIVEDLQSGSGTLVNGMPVTRRILQHGDIMQFGAYYLRYLNPRASEESNLERTMLIAGLQVDGVRPDSGASFGAERAPSSRATKVRFPNGRVRMLTGYRAGSTIELDRVIATFGHHREQLAVITRRPQGYFITHVEGRRYPSVNGETLGKQPRALRNGDVVEVADEKLKFTQD